jgi:hypothetical protein
MERDIEQALIKSVRKAGGLCLKFVSPGWSGVPDRLCLWPGGRINFVELKRPGAKPRPLQIRRAEQLRRLGFQVEVIDRKEQVPEFVEKAGGVGAQA